VVSNAHIKFREIWSACSKVEMAVHRATQSLSLSLSHTHTHTHRNSAYVQGSDLLNPLSFLKEGKSENNITSSPEVGLTS
jgi:hypothetical protein